MRTLGAYLAALTLVSTANGVARAQDDSVVVLTALPVTYSISSALAENTSIVVRVLPERPRPMGALGNFFESAGERFGDQLREADAVVTIGKLWSADPLFTAVRAENIRVVEIDATKPWSTTLEGVAVAFEPVSTASWAVPGEDLREPSLYFWLSPANGVRAAEIVAADLVRLSPADSDQIAGNLDAYRRRLLELKREYDVKFVMLPELTVFSLAPEFVYLTSDMGIYVDSYFFKQDIDWTLQDLESFRSYLEDNSVRVVLHKWEPSEAIQAAIVDAGARWVVLDMGDLGIVEDGQLNPDSYIETMRANLEALYNAFSAIN